jgi:hypothetical protein
MGHNTVRLYTFIEKEICEAETDILGVYVPRKLCQLRMRPRMAVDAQVTHIEQNLNPCCGRLITPAKKVGEEGGKCGRCGIKTQHFRRCGWDQLSYL